MFHCAYPYGVVYNYCLPLDSVNWLYELHFRGMLTIVYMFFSILISDPELLQLNWFMNFEQWYTSIDFIYIIISFNCIHASTTRFLLLFQQLHLLLVIRGTFYKSDNIKLPAKYSNQSYKKSYPAMNSS